MRIEVPILQRCCFCLPLRRGLIVWGYFKLIIASLLLLFSLIGLHQVLNLFAIYKSKLLIKNIIILVVIFVLSIIDIILHAIFIVGGHKKSAKLLRIYYFYAITLIVLTFVLGLVTSGLMIKNMAEQYTERLKLLFISDLTTMIINLLIQGYVLILVRSELVKLNNYNSFRFVNNAADANCTLNIDNMEERAEEKEAFIDNQEQECFLN